MIPLFRRWWFGQTVAFFAFLPYLTSLTRPWSRLELGWSRSDAGQILLIVMMTGAVFALAAWITARFCSFETARERLILVLLFVFLWPTINRFGKMDFTLKLLLVAVLGIGVVRYPSRTRSVLQTVLFVLSPTLVIFFIQAFFFKLVPNVSMSSEKRLDSAGVSGPPIVFFLFDEWSYSRAFFSENPAENLAGLNKLARQSYIFHDAQTPGSTTNESIPKLLGTPFLNKGSIEFKDSIFSVARKNNWSASVVGCYLPYAYWFQGDAAYCRQIPSYKWPTSNFLKNTRSHFDLMILPWLATWNASMAKSFFDRHATDVQRARWPVFQQQVQELLKNVKPRTLIYFHNSFPHDPFLGDFQNPEQGYANNIQLADQMLREAIQILQENRAWEESLIVVTSDHAWKEDPARRHVPLLIKMPFQQSRVDIFRKFETVWLKDILTKVMKSNGDPKKMKLEQWLPK